MRKIGVVIIAVVLTGLTSLAQERNAFNVENPFRVQVYTGGPNFLKSATKFSSNFQDKVTYNGRPMIGVEADYKIVDWFSLGVDVSYRYGQLDVDVLDSSLFEEINDKWGVDVSQYADPFGHYSLKVPKFKAMVKANFHALPNESRSDLYFTIGIGYNKVKPRLFLDDNEIQFFKRIGTFSLPLAYRTSVGYSYNFTKNIGAFAEVGIGGPIVSGGLNLKF